MKLMNVLPVLLAVVLSACGTSATQKINTASAAQQQGTVLRFAVLGDAEPKPKAEFPGVAAAVQDINAMAEKSRLDFVVGVGDIAHKGTLLQYDNVTPVLQQLSLPFYPIMGNEEHGSTVERFLEYANRWNNGKAMINSPRYIQEYDSVALVYASPDFGRDFNDDGVAWIQQEIQRLAPKPVLLIVHGAQAGVYPENAEKGIHNANFSAVIEQSNLAAVISGDLHMDMDRTQHSKQIGHVHYLHIPALERTKIPDENHHVPMFRVFSIDAGGNVWVETYQTGKREALARHRYEFTLPR